VTEVSRIADQLRRAYDGDPWDGQSLAVLLAGISARDAAAHPLPGAHSIQETVLHTTAWIGEVRERLRGSPPGQPSRGDWPDPGDTGESGWALAKSELARAHEELLRELESTPEERLWEIVGSPARDRAEGTGTTYYVMLHGLVQHNVYHSAQMAALRRIQAGR
jgi:uncharacterized damage-inducible protein DinB